MQTPTKKDDIGIKLLFSPEVKVTPVYPVAVREVVVIDAVKYGVQYKKDGEHPRDIPVSLVFIP